MTTITAVTFDMTGVLTPSIFTYLGTYASELGLPVDAFNRFWRGDPKIARLELGSITARDFFKYVCIDAEAEHGQRIDIHRLAAAADQTVDATRIHPAMIDLIAELRIAGYATALLTNNVKEARWREGFPFQLFDHLLDSSELALRKPDPRIYQQLINRLDRPASEIVFVDDFEENLPPAEALGIRTVHFTGINHCRRQLLGLGVRLTMDSAGSPLVDPDSHAGSSRGILSGDHA